ncbi:hypothetical protein ACNOYE_18595 [Nannocystaceae bacterium ST9]
MSASVERSTIALALMIGGSLLPAACMKRSDATSPDAGAAEFAQPPVDSDPLAELDRLEQRMLQLGMTPAPSRWLERERTLDEDQTKRPTGGKAGKVEEAGDISGGLVEQPEQPDDKPHEDLEEERDAKLDWEANDQVVDPPTQAPPSEPEPTSSAVTRDAVLAPTASGLGEGESRCVSVCELSESICELEVRICSMANNHDGDPIYSDACERAVDDCELSGDACDTCVE